MKRVHDYTDVELAALGGHIGPTGPGERTSAARKPQPTRVPSLEPRTNHLPVRRPLFAAQRVPEE